MYGELHGRIVCGLRCNPAFLMLLLLLLLPLLLLAT